MPLESLAREKRATAEGDEWILQVMRKEMQRVHSELSQLRKDSTQSAFLHQVKGKAQGRLQTKEESTRAMGMKTEAGEDCSPRSCISE